MKRVAILGSTGSIGQQTLDVAARHPDRFEVVALSAGSRVADLAAQARRFGVRTVSCAAERDVPQLRAGVASGVRVESGAAGLLAVAAESGAEIVVAATDGMVSFEAVAAALERGVDVALANKELLVAAGELLLAAAASGRARLLPIDSEHSALFQCLVGEPRERVASLVLTASGGPFWRTDAAVMRGASVADALAHPTWRMGTKNTVDSATMMNKGLEVIEAARLFGLPAERIDVLVHPTSIVHGFAVFTDGSVKAQLASPDMRVPIGYALAYPDRLPGEPPADPLAAIGAQAGAQALTLAFERPDFERFVCLRLAYDALRTGGTATAVLSAANEIAVTAFVEKRLRFGEIAEVVEAALDGIPAEPLSWESLAEADARARTLARDRVAAKA